MMFEEEIDRFFGDDANYPAALMALRVTAFDYHITPAECMAIALSKDDVRMAHSIRLRMRDLYQMLNTAGFGDCYCR